MSRIFVHIGARQGSKGVKNKNIKILNKKPLIAWSIIQAKKIKNIYKIVINSDSNKILNISKNHGADILIKRPKKLSNAKLSKFLVWKHSVNFLKKKYNLSNSDLFLDLDCTCPLREIKDIKKIISSFYQKKKKKIKFDGIISITEPKKNPYFNLLEKKPNNFLKICKKTKKPIVARQNTPKVYEHAANIYALKPEFILKKNYLLSGKILGHFVHPLASWDIDSLYDFKIIKILFKNKKN